MAAIPARVEGATELLQYAIDEARSLPAERQDEIARTILQLAYQAESLGEDEIDADLEKSLAEAERGEFATDEEVRAVWAKHGL